MAIGCRLGVFILLSSAGFILSEDFKFRHKKNVIVLLEGSKAGPIGKIRVAKTRSDISYSIRGAKSSLDIDKDSGKLFLKENLNGRFVAQLNNSMVIIEAVKKRTSEKTTAEVILIILPLFYGDQFVTLLGSEAASGHKNPKLPKLEKVSPRSLLRFLRRSPEKTKKIALGHLKFEIRLAKIKKMIKKQIVGIFGKGFFISLYLHLKQLFSGEMMDEMEEDCVEEIVPESCDRGKRKTIRTIDGTCNNNGNDRTRGASNTGFIRIRPAMYFDSDGLNDPIGYPDQPDAPDLPSPFEISNDFIIDEVAKQSSSDILSHLVMQMGQFIDHDLDLAVEVESEDGENCLEVPCNGSLEDRECPCYPILPAAGSACTPVTRSAAICQHGSPKPREQINVNTAFVDASQIYGSTDDVADKLREIDPVDLGLLRSSPGPDGPLLPFDNSASPLCRDLGGCFVAGDARTNEQQALTSFHTLFLREHNRIARILKTINEHWNGEDVYQQTRSIMGAVMQKIVYEDYLYVVLGPNALPKYKNYDKSVDPGVSGAFATSAFRYGHSLIRNEFAILDKAFNPVGSPIELRFMFFNNSFITMNGINPLLLGLISNVSEIVDRALSPGLTQNLFERPNSPGQNLAALNIQRSRDHGIPGYNSFREFCKLRIAQTFDDTADEITDPENRKILERLYAGSPDLVELWIAGLAETPINGGAVGATFNCIISDQFRRTRDGDRFFYENRGLWRPDQLAEIKKASMSRIYCDNLDVVSIQPNAFKAPTAPDNRRISCERIPRLDLCTWKDKPLPGPFKWFGKKCESAIAEEPVPWHATFVNSNNDIVCSGALISRKYVITTSLCFRAIKKDIGEYSVLLGYYKTTVNPRVRRSIEPEDNRNFDEVWRITLSKPISDIKGVKPIAQCTRESGLITTWVANREHLQAVPVSIDDARNRVFPALLTEETGSPLVSENGGCLIGLMVGVNRFVRPNARLYGGGK